MSAHSVGFYEHESYLVSQVMGFIGPALAEGAAAVLIADPDHRSQFEAGLSRLPARASIDQSRIIALDAADTMARFMVDDWPHEGRFRAVLGEVIRDAGRRGNGTVRAFGEMVALLWREGKCQAAIRLEQM